MTDISNKFNIYYNVFFFNPGPTPVEIVFNEQFVFPLLQKCSDYKVSIVKAKFDLSAEVFPPGNPLDKLLINSNTIGVIGSYYGGNGQLLTQGTILDVDYNQTTPDPIVYFVPYYPQQLTMNSDLPLTRLNLSVVYQLENGQQAPLRLLPGKSFSCRLLFTRLY